MGKPKHSDDPRGVQKGAQTHAQGQHGPKSSEARKAEITARGSERDDRSESAPRDPRAAGRDAERHERMMADPSLNRDGGHRLVENRLQHDEAEKNSEKNRMMRDADRHGHDREGFQIPGGRESHPAAGTDGPQRTMKAGGQGGGNRSDEDRGSR
jgi:hypothetical protein